MNLEPAPRLNKTPFVLTAAGCVTAVILIGLFSENKFAPLPFLSAVGFLLISMTAFMIPYLVDYAANSSEYVQRERERGNEQVQRLHTAGESLARAAAQIKAVEEAVHKTAHSAENLPYRMQEKLAEFNQALAEKENSERESLERELDELRAASSDQLRVAAEKIARATADWTALEQTTRQQFSTTQEAAGKLDEKFRSSFAQFEAKLKSALAEFDRRLPGLQLASPSPTISAPIASAAVPAEVVVPAEPAAPVPPVPVAPPPAAAEIPVIESVTLSDTSTTGEPKIRKPRAPRKPKPEDIPAAMSEPAATGAVEDTPATTISAPLEAKPIPADPDEPASTSAGDSVAETPTREEPATSSDGATRLLATAYIGIGNKLFIRGDGPGLSWEKGVPMQFVSIGKWGWASSDVTATVRAKLYKNDDILALSGEVVLPPGKHVEVTALF